MNNDDRFNSSDELDEEIAKSVEKLVDEETSVARAFVNRDAGSSVNTDIYTNNNHDIAGNPDNDVLGRTQMIPDIGKTQVIPDVTKTQIIPDIKDAAKYQSDGNTRNSRSTRNIPDRNTPPKPESPKHNDKKNNKTAIMLVSGIVGAAIIVFLIIALIINSNKKNSYEYNYSTGLSFYNAGNYSDALTYWEKASKDAQGRKNIELKLKMYECYIAAGKRDQAVDILKDALSYDKYNQKALTSLAQYYVNQKDGTALTELLRKYKGTDGEKHLKEYEVSMPSASEASGKYDKVLELELKSENSYKIYYTTDGLAVTTKSTEYTQPVRIESGKTTVKAIAVDNIGTMSYELELKFDIDYKGPDAPAVTPVTGTYDAGTSIEITNIPDGASAYYTLDGKTPTRDSTLYTEAVSMPEGNTVFSAIIIDQYNMSSSVTKRNYNVGVSTKYTFDEAVDRLKVAMTARHDLNKDGTSADGGQAKFTYYKKTSIANVEMYITFYDIVKNGVTTRQTYYFGIDVATGKCYKVYDQNGTLIATEY